MTRPITMDGIREGDIVRARSFGVFMVWTKIGHEMWRDQRGGLYREGWAFEIRLERNEEWKTKSVK
jgi:hypothetical protein